MVVRWLLSAAFRTVMFPCRQVYRRAQDLHGHLALLHLLMSILAALRRL